VLKSHTLNFDCAAWPRPTPLEENGEAEIVNVAKILPAPMPWLEAVAVDMRDSQKFRNLPDICHRQETPSKAEFEQAESSGQGSLSSGIS
jgi:hypothetical protein